MVQWLIDEFAQRRRSAPQMAEEIAMAMEAMVRKVEQDLHYTDDESEEKDVQKKGSSVAAVLPVFGKAETEVEPEAVTKDRPEEVVVVGEVKPARFNRTIAKMEAAVNDTVTKGMKVSEAAEKNRVDEEKLLEELQNRGLIERLNAGQLLPRRQASVLPEPTPKRRGRPPKNLEQAPVKEKEVDPVEEIEEDMIEIQTKKKGGRKGRAVGGDESDDSWTDPTERIKKPRLKEGGTKASNQDVYVRAKTSNQVKRSNQPKREVSLPKTVSIIKEISPEIPVQESPKKQVLELERIVEIREVRQFLVKWKGKNEMTWENEDIFKGTKKNQYNFKY